MKEFSLDNIAWLEEKDGNIYIQGPFSPIMAAKSIIEHWEKERFLIGMVRVWLNDNAVHNYREGKEGYTSFDTLIIVLARKEESKLLYGFFPVVDCGLELVPVTFWSPKDKELPFLSSAYKNYRFEKHLTPAQWAEIMRECNKDKFWKPKKKEVKNENKD